MSTSRRPPEGIATKPSDFPRPERFRDPLTPPFRDEHGLHHVFSYADVLRVLRNASGAFSRDPSDFLPADVHHMVMDFMWAFEPFPVSARPPRHDALRGVVEPWFRGRPVRAMEPLVRGLAVELLDGIVAKGAGELDLARELAYPLSIRVICRLVGIELEREVWLRERLAELSQARSFADFPRQWDLEAYFWQLVAKRLARPKDELLDALVTSWREGTIDDRELLGYLAGFVAAGTDTTGTNLVNAFALLSEFDRLEDVRARLDDEQAMRCVVEEILRFGTPFAVKPLFVLEEVRFGDLVVPRGSVLNVWFAAANRDERVNGGVEQADPAAFDPARWPNRHLTLGHGTHHCLGAELARLVTRVLLREGLLRLPGLHLDPTRAFERYAGVVDGVTQAPFTFDQEEAERIARVA